MTLLGSLKVSYLLKGISPCAKPPFIQCCQGRNYNGGIKVVTWAPPLILIFSCPCTKTSAMSLGHVPCVAFQGTASGKDCGTFKDLIVTSGLLSSRMAVSHGSNLIWWLYVLYKHIRRILNLWNTGGHKKKAHHLKLQLLIIYYSKNWFEKICCIHNVLRIRVWITRVPLWLWE